MPERDPKPNTISQEQRVLIEASGLQQDIVSFTEIVTKLKGDSPSLESSTYGLNSQKLVEDLRLLEAKGIIERVFRLTKKGKNILLSMSQASVPQVAIENSIVSSGASKPPEDAQGKKKEKGVRISGLGGLGKAFAERNQEEGVEK